MPYADRDEQRCYDAAKYQRNKQKYIDRANKRYLANKEEINKKRLRKYYDEKSSPSGHIILLARHAIIRAKKNNINYDERIIDFLSKNPPTHCKICNIEINYTTNIGTGPGDRLTSPSIDRIIPNKGYVINNVQVICTNCNGKKWIY